MLLGVVGSLLRKVKTGQRPTMLGVIASIYNVLSLRSRRLEVVGARKNGCLHVSPSRALVLSCAHYFQAPATQAMCSERTILVKDVGKSTEEYCEY